MNLESVRAGLANVAANVNGLHIYEWVPSSINPPAAVISLNSGLYDSDFSDGMTVQYSILVMLTRADDKYSQASLDEFLSQGNDSFFAAVDADPTLGGVCDSARLIGWQDPSTYTIAGIDYVGVEINVEVIG